MRFLRVGFKKTDFGGSVMRFFVMRYFGGSVMRFFLILGVGYEKKKSIRIYTVYTVYIRSWKLA